MSHRIETALTWLYLKIDYVLSIALGMGSIALDVEIVLIKMLLALVLGACGWLGGQIMKTIVLKIKRRK